ncbi:MAG TPA: TraB/GumN family protein [Steroidobacteraceae bacterium]|nr:TraB/GumN family protein [Steroidobacteraceae bacterium]
MSAMRRLIALMVTGLIVACGTSNLPSACAQPSPAQAPAPLPAPMPSTQPAQVLQELVVTGERTGPGLWRVHHGDAQVWILGSISPLPRGITWRSTQVERVLGSTQQVLVSKPLEIGIVRILWLLLTERSVLMVRGGKRLKDVMPPALHERFAQQRARFTHDDDKWERFRPIIAAAFLEQAAFHSVGLSARLDLGAAVRGLAKKHGVRVEELKIAGIGDVLDALKTMPPATENTCVNASLVTVQSALPQLMDRARAWATGDVERIESHPAPAEVDACLRALDSGAAAGDLLGRIRRAWLDALLQSLQGGGTTLAVVNMDLLLGKGGLLDELRGRGYDVDGPTAGG